MTEVQQRSISAKANFLRKQEVKRSGRSQNRSDARREGMTLKHSGRNRNPVLMRGDKT